MRKVAQNKLIIQINFSRKKFIVIYVNFLQYALVVGLKFNVGSRKLMWCIVIEIVFSVATLIFSNPGSPTNLFLQV